LGRSVRNERYRYTEWDGGKEGAELYDYQTDPNEFTNLVRNPQAAPVVASMKREQRRFIRFVLTVFFSCLIVMPVLLGL